VQKPITPEPLVRRIREVLTDDGSSLPPPGLTLSQIADQRQTTPVVAEKSHE
jgi:hypothetical protein